MAYPSLSTPVKLSKLSLSTSKMGDDPLETQIPIEAKALIWQSKGCVLEGKSANATEFTFNSLN